jgi:hypothetical protein
MLGPHWPAGGLYQLGEAGHFISHSSDCVDFTRKGMVRPSGFEPPRYCYRQPLKLVRLPVPPRPRFRT